MFWLALLVEPGFFLQVRNLQVTLGDAFAVGVSWGFWGAAGVNAAAAAAGVGLLTLARSRFQTLAAERRGLAATAEP